MIRAFRSREDEVAALCTRWRIRSLSVFGSALTSEWRVDSDIDLLVDFTPDARWDLMDWVRLREELEALLGRPIDLVERSALQNPYRRKRILAESEVLYAA